MEKQAGDRPEMDPRDPRRHEGRGGYPAWRRGAVRDMTPDPAPEGRPDGGDWGKARPTEENEGCQAKVLDRMIQY